MFLGRRETIHTFIERCLQKGHTIPQAYRLLQKQAKLRARRSKDMDFFSKLDNILDDYINEYRYRILETLNRQRNEFLTTGLVNNELEALLRTLYIEVGIYTHRQFSVEYRLPESVQFNQLDLWEERQRTLSRPISSTTQELLLNDPEYDFQSRAETIAKTEVLTASNMAEYETMRNSGKMKYWIGILDNRIRDSHESATKTYNKNNAIDINSSFIINGSLAKYPHDPTLPAKELVNCRCRLGYV